MSVRIGEELCEHYRLYVNGSRWAFSEMSFDELKVELEDVEWEMTPYRGHDLVHVVRVSTKRSRNEDENKEERQSKRIHIAPQQLLGPDAQDNRGPLDTNAMSPISHRYGHL